MYLAIAGNIGVGKSTLTRLLSERLRLTPVYEAVDENPYLEDFYRDMPSYAFHSQMFFLSKRLEQHLRQVNVGERIIQDRTIYEDAGVFARNLFEEGILSPRDYATYTGMYDAIAAALRPPDLMLYLRASVPTLQRHITLRGRDYERDIASSYLEQLNRLYEQWAASYTLSELLIVETDELDFLNRSEDLRGILERLEPYGLSTPLL